MKRWKKFSIPLMFLVSLALLTGCSLTQAGSSGSEPVGSNAAASAEPGKEAIVVNIGIQQSISPLLLAKEKGWFEEEFAKAGATVNWVEFQSGPPHFEAIASGRLDFGRVGNIPVLAGQAAAVPFKEIAVGSLGEKADSILVTKDSPIKTLQDLKGKQIAVAKASSGYGLLFHALDYSGLKPSDVKIIQLQPDEAQPAFETGKVDAWAIWEPYPSIEVVKNGARVLADGKAINAYSPGFHIVRSAFAEEHPDLVVLYLKVMEKATRWQKEHPEEAIDLYAALKKTDKETMRRVMENTEPLNLPTTPEVIQMQQETADFLVSQGGLKGKIDVSAVVDNQYIEKALREYDLEEKE
ncbi:aliphatic sulfonate ABC transporter substrate-binding protein [Brevibacillus fulvus]|uniref:Putative aliphatic sulfonates-binding protein n=1 Tax=Brevibacillus fulvus TaxID=1125967 RepID=A0A939BU04_9BACL|nr:aliphatic sulfonate ABC transporter substrate-binding protein [Brevibacillus fulvus]MBM7589006.1 sulfonate transport system substrate-binding protein [Brevibacillus fulvus]